MDEIKKLYDVNFFGLIRMTQVRTWCPVVNKPLRSAGR